MKEIKKKTVFISGGTQGLGLKLVEGYIKNNYLVISGSSNERNINHATEFLNKKKYNEKDFIFYKFDLSDRDKLSHLLNELFKENLFTALISNAAILGTAGNSEDIELIEFEKVFSVNFFGTIFLINKFIEHFKRVGGGKIVQISGGGATSPLPYLTPYGCSKAAIARYIESISVEVKKFQIFLNCIAPGILDTNMLDRTLEFGSKKIGEEYFNHMKNAKESGGSNIDLSVDLSLFLTSENSGELTGKLISSKWDNWKIFNSNLKKLIETDIYTIRRIIGKDRDFPEGDY